MKPIEVLSATLRTPPADPQPGDRYYIPIGAEAEWEDLPGWFTQWTGDAWAFEDIDHGTIMHVMDTSPVGELQVIDGELGPVVNRCLWEPAVFEWTRGTTDYVTRKSDCWSARDGWVVITEDGNLRWETADAGTFNMTEDLGAASTYLHGEVKWDGCSNWHFDEQDRVMLHGCSRHDVQSIGAVMLACWDLAKELCPMFEGD